MVGITRSSIAQVNNLSSAYGSRGRTLQFALGSPKQAVNCRRLEILSSLDEKENTYEKSNSAGNFANYWDVECIFPRFREPRF